MINSTELKNTQLRRLNKVLYKGDIKTIDCISPGYVAFLEDRPNSDNFGEWIDLDEVEFIELTEEILKKIEDIKVSFTSDPQEPGASKLYKIGVIKIYQPNEDVEYFILCNEEEIIHLKYLHQLQNIVFDLSNQELEIKL